jgi:hypothetical protein
VLEFLNNGGQEPRRNRVFVTAHRIHRLAELVLWNRFLGSLKVLKFGLSFFLVQCYFRAMIDL